jgi:hypothetical protein
MKGKLLLCGLILGFNLNAHANTVEERLTNLENAVARLKSPIADKKDGVVSGEKFFYNISDKCEKITPKDQRLDFGQSEEFVMAKYIHCPEGDFILAKIDGSRIFMLNADDVVLY